MAGRYLQILLTPEVLEQQAKYYNKAQRIPPQPEVDPLTADEVDFIGRRDSFYIASVTSKGTRKHRHCAEANRRQGLWPGPCGGIARHEAHNPCFAHHSSRAQPKGRGIRSRSEYHVHISSVILMSAS